MSDLPHRSRKILIAVVTEFIATGAPVGSRTLARRYGLELSPASIRNVLADLEEAGYLKQPHTSAGRIPTDRALRVFIDTLIDARSISPEEQARLGARFTEIYAGAEDPLRETGRLLSELTGTAALVGRPRTDLRALQQLRFIPTRPGQLLAVLVFTNGDVENRFIAVDEVIDDDELMRVHNLLRDVIEGRTLGEVRDLFVRRLADERTRFDALRHRAFSLGKDAVIEVAKPSEFVLEGQSRLLELPDYADVDRLKRVMRALEEREEIVSLLDKTLVAGVAAVYVGAEAGELASGDLSLVVAPYEERGKMAGAIGVLGPTRMDYAKVVPLVDATAAAMSEAMKKARPGG
jgi:heat-inducible transcriptional repressor